MSQHQNDPWVTFGYEVEMFRCLLQDLRDPGMQSLLSRHWEIRNAVTESILLSARQLADILLSRTNDPSDIALTEILPGFQPTRFGDLQAAYGNRHSGICYLLNKFAMHPSKLRTESYDYTSILQQLEPIIEDIVCEIERKRGSTAFEWMSGGKAVALVNTSASPTAATNVATSDVWKPQVDVLPADDD